MFDISLTEDMDMVAQIKKEVKKLCTRNIIAAQITVNERDQDKRENLARMIYESEQDMKVYFIVNHSLTHIHPLRLIDFSCNDISVRSVLNARYFCFFRQSVSIVLYINSFIQTSFWNNGFLLMCSKLNKKAVGSRKEV